MSLHPLTGSTCLHVREGNLIGSRDCELPQLVWINAMLWVLLVGICAGRKLGKNPLGWSFDILVKIGLEAGWLQGLETQAAPQLQTGRIRKVMLRQRRRKIQGWFCPQCVISTIHRFSARSESPV